MSRVVIIDYDAGNVDSVARAFEENGARVEVSASPAVVRAAERLVLPGVGALAACMASLRDTGLPDLLHERVLQEKVPILGICIGMQLMMSGGDEGGEVRTLGWLDARVERLRPGPGERLPHVGWNTVRANPNSRLFSDTPPETDFYFVHSYGVLTCDPAAIAATCDYAGGFVAAFERDNVAGVQFHPEKSQKAGFRLIRRFLAS